MKLIVGLGNPGRRYEGTRHNLGFAVLAELARRLGAGRPNRRFHGELAEADLEGERLLLLGPLTYMNQSGTSVLAARDYFGLPNEQLLVICDDLNLPLAKLRIRPSGSAGGHRGLADVIDKLQTEEFPRLRIGIGPPPEDSDATDFVLARFTEQERPQIEQAVCSAAEAVAEWARQGIDYCMNRYN
ncbi:MAG: aminoacyl-tRNA hydrolase [Thermoguttaceae bacterium]